MRVVAYRLRCALRRGVGETVVLALVITVVSAAILTFAAGAERTASAPARYIASQDALDALLYQEEGRRPVEDLERLPGVRSASTLTFMFGGLIPEGREEPLDTLTFFGSITATGNRLVEGREARAERPGEFVVTRTFVEQHHARIGDRFRLITLTQEQADTEGYNASEPKGPSRSDAVLVGVVDGPSQLDDPTALALFSPALGRDDRIGTSATIFAVDLDDGVTQRDLRREVDTLEGGEELTLQSDPVLSAEIRRAVDAQAKGLWALTVVGGVASVVALGQVLRRRGRVSPAERACLVGMGVTDRQIGLESAGRIAIPVVVGVAAGGGLSTLFSSQFPTGFVRRVEPAPGFRVDWSTLLGAGVVLLVALAAWVTVGLLISQRAARRTRSAPIAAPLVGFGDGAASTGVRFAFMTVSRDRGSPRSAVLGVSALVAGLIGILTFGSSLDRLIDQPERYGRNYMMTLGAGEEELSTELKDAFERAPGVEGLAYYATTDSRAGSDALALVGREPAKGSVDPPVLEGRLPTGLDELALGRNAARRLDVGVGDRVRLRVGSRVRTYEVSGIAVIPGLGANDGIGEDAMMSIDALRRLVPNIPVSTGVVAVAPGTSPPELAKQLGPDIGAPLLDGDPGEKPPVILNVERVQAVPYVLALLLAFLAVLTIGNEMLRAVQNRRRDVAILRAMGAGRGWVSRVVHWQATVFTLVPLVVGVPLGIVVGRVGFRLFASSMGTVDDPSSPYLVAGLVLVGLLLLANLAAEVPARLARRVSPGVLLKAE